MSSVALPTESGQSTAPPNSEAMSQWPLSVSENGQPEPGTAVDGPVVRSSDELIPHPSSDVQVPRSSAPGEVAEGYASGVLPSGTTLGHFVIQSLIGGGGMGRVYLTTDTALDRKVALKVLHRQRPNEQGTAARFTNEARSAARLNHEHIAQVYFSGEESGIPFIVFEYVEGTNIRALVEENGLFSVPQAIIYLIQIANALAHAAAHGVIHRDVKPSNILITPAGRAKLIDMGLARLLDPSESQADLTASGVTLGTFDYISPEQARDPRAADIRSDIYSLGCTFFFMLTGQPPFPEGTVLQKLLQHQGDEPPDVRTFQPDIPPEVALLIQKMMAKDPRQRFQTPSHLVDALIQVAEMLGLRPSESGKLDWTAGLPEKKSLVEKHLPWFAAVSVLLLLFAGLHVLWNQGDSTSPPPIPITDVTEPVIVESLTEPFRPTSVHLGAEGNRSVFSPSAPNERALLNARSLPPLTNIVSGKESLGIEVTADAISAGWPPSELKAEFSGSLPFVPVKDSNVSPSGYGDSVPLRLTVDPGGKTPGAYISLSTAIAEAGKQATIELKWNGPLGIDPMALNGCELSIIAAPEYTPMLSFKPTDTMYFSQNSRSMFTLNGCSLEFRDVAVEMWISQDVLASRWTLFELFGPNKLTFTRCCLTLQNAASDYSAYHQDVAFFRNSPPQIRFENLTVENLPPPPEWYAMAPYDVNSKPGVHLKLSDSLLRGEAVALQCEAVQAVDFRLEHSCVALARSFVQIEDVARTSKQDNTTVHVWLDHAFIYSRRFLAKQNRSMMSSEILRLAFDSQLSIIRLNQTPLAELQGSAFPTTLAESPFRWTGRDNFFQNVSLGWKLRPISSPNEPETASEMTLDKWKDQMGASVILDQLTLPEIRKPAHRLTPTDMLPDNLQNIGPARDRTMRLPNDWNVEPY